MTRRKRPLDVYCYGMNLVSVIHSLDGDYPAADSYREIRESRTAVSGENGNAAVILAGFGLRVKMDGPWLGTGTRAPILSACKRLGIDASGMRFDPGYEGVFDLVLTDRHTRTIFGKFGSYFSSRKHRWTPPDRRAIRDCRAVSLDPFFRKDSERAGRWCAEDGKKFVTLDCRYDSLCHRLSTVNVISGEFRRSAYPGVDPARLLEKYTKNTDGLVVFTFGKDPIWYSRKNGPVSKMRPFDVKASGTLAAGDTFRAAAVYGVFQGWDDRRIVRFAAAAGAVACMRQPVSLFPPRLRDIGKLVSAEG